MRNLELLKSMLADGTFSHATYRCIGTVWEGLWFYRAVEARVGYEVAGCVNASDQDGLKAAESLLASHGISTHVGAYGEG